MTIAPADFNAMPRVTATQLAERTYAASLERRRAQAAGNLPDPRAIYRPQIDAHALRKHSDDAYDAHERIVVSPTARAAVSVVLAADIDTRFPPADMEVLARYGAARATDLVHVVLKDGRSISLPMDARLLPGMANSFSANCCPDRRPVPAETQALFDRLANLRRERRAQDVLLGWPSRFKAQHTRWPRWAEIEDHWPILGRYLADRRAESMP